jgi:phosphoglycerate dehydrogenase-like enzyme
VAEHVMAMVLAHLRRLPELLAAQRTARWLDPFPVRELRGTVAGVLGLGDLGASSAGLLRACGATVLGLRRSGGPVAGVDETFAPDLLHELLPRAEVLVLALPLTPLTRGMVGARELRLLPDGAFVVNVGRGPVLDEVALAAELRGGRLAGAALDVFAEEPLPASSPLWELPGVIVSPHCADVTVQTEERCLALYLDQVARFRAGRPLASVVGPSRGY